MPKRETKTSDHLRISFLKISISIISLDPRGLLIFFNQRLSIEAKIDLVKMIGEEIIDIGGLRRVFENVQSPIWYDGFEPSGRMHIA